MYPNPRSNNSRAKDRVNGSCLTRLSETVRKLPFLGVQERGGSSKDGKLDSRAGIKGLIAKGGILAVLIVARVLDLTMGTDFILSGAVVAFIANESISIVENYALTGRPVPEVIYRALTQLNSTDEKHKEP